MNGSREITMKANKANEVETVKSASIVLKAVAKAMKKFDTSSHEVVTKVRDYEEGEKMGDVRLYVESRVTKRGVSVEQMMDVMNHLFKPDSGTMKASNPVSIKYGDGNVLELQTTGDTTISVWAEDDLASELRSAKIYMSDSEVVLAEIVFAGGELVFTIFSPTFLDDGSQSWMVVRKAERQPIQAFTQTFVPDADFISKVAMEVMRKYITDWLTNIVRI
jgi:hypothetical protein